MKTTAKWQLTLGLIVVAGFAAQGKNAAADSPVESLSFTIHVRNYAGVDRKTLTEAEQVASGIFQKAGVISQWVDAPVTSEDLQKASAGRHSSGPSQLWMNLLPRTMSDRMNLPAGVTGLAPGTGPDRVLAYVFYDRVEDRAQRQVAAHNGPLSDRRATAEQILGEVMAHEIGHILLNLAVHTKTGIMRGDWDLNDLKDIACSRLGFTPQQAEVMRADVLRRAAQSQTLEVAELEQPAPAR